MPQQIVGDGLRLRQILVNLLNNAVKFTVSGEVVVRLNVAREGPASHLEIEVADTGIGMTADEVTRLFRPFEQADRSTSRRFGGTGLGLAITRMVLSLMNGRIDVTSEPGVGTTFRVRLPIQVADEDRVTLPSPLPIKVLLVEDNASSG